MFQRSLLKIIKEKLFDGKVIVLMGPRQVGKTTLLKELSKETEQTLWLNGDDPDTQVLFDGITTARFKSIIGINKLLVIDEAQQIKNIGLKLKLVADELKEVQVVATGSSSFDLANEINEPLTGRKWEYQMYPMAFAEMVQHHGLLEELKLLPHRMVFGYYPEVVTNNGKEVDFLKQLSDSYLFKDILIWNKIKKSDKVIKLLQALAFQVGHQVSYNELGRITGLNNETVESYIQLLEQAFVVFRMSSLNRNLRNELKKSKKIYFYDNGIRNTLIANFNHLELRNDVGALWENFIISERQKHLAYNQKYANKYFWRTLAQQEIDYIEEREGKLFAYEFKWNSKAKARFPKSFLTAYPETETKVITPDNFETFVN